MEIKDIKITAEKLYKDIELNGIDAIREIFSKGTTMCEQLRINPIQEYMKKMIISQLDIDNMLKAHLGYGEKYEKESEQLHRIIFNEGNLKFDENTINVLFGNLLDITSNDDYEEWKEFACEGKHNGVTHDTLCLEEKIKHNYENERNIIKKFIKSFRYKNIKKGSALEDRYIIKVREMLRKEILENPENTLTASSNVLRALGKGLEQYQSIKEIEDISRMTLIPFMSNKDIGPINIEETCKLIRKEMKTTIGSTKIGKDYRKKEVTLGSEEGINRRPVFKAAPFEEIPQAMEKLQKEYEDLYKKEQSTEEYIKGATKIYADFMFLQPYEDGNKRTALCLLNSMLISKNIIPQPISLVNDEEMIKAFYKAQEKDYTMLQELIIEKYNGTKNANGEDIPIIKPTDKTVEIQ